MAEEPRGDNDWVVIARVVGPRGNRGELQVIPLTGGPARFQEAGEIYLRMSAPGGRSYHRLAVEDAWQRKARVVLKLRGVDSISEAERWRGADVCVPLASRPPLPDGEYYQSDLIGCEVRDRHTGRLLGKVVDWQEFGGPPLVRVEDAEGGELLIPFAGSICTEIDPSRRRILVDLPEGLKDLNR